MKTIVRQFCKDCFTNYNEHKLYTDPETGYAHFNLGKCLNEDKHKETDK